ncbi:HNH endonuclease [Bdellovibrionota bacterium FG-2]
MANKPFYELDQDHVDPVRLKQEREKARKLRQSTWWREQLSRGVCHYCDGKFKPTELTLDHVVPLARGGTSTKGNIVPCCAKCNQEKKLDTPVDRILAQLRAERENKS